MQSSNLYSILVLAGIILAALIIIGIIIARLYKRSSKEVSFVRTGFGGEKVIMSYQYCYQKVHIYYINKVLINNYI